MLQGLRQHGFMLNGCCAALLFASLLLSALAPCMAAANDAPQETGMAQEVAHEMGGMIMAMDMASMDGHCPHCDVATTPCMEASVACAAQPAALLKAPEFERQIDKPLAVMPQVVAPPTAAQAIIAAEYPALQPCKLSGRDRRVLFCSFQE